VSEDRRLRRGDIWLFEPDPAVGREQSGVRPGVIVSIDLLNQGPRDVLIMVPLTGTSRPSEDFPFHVKVDPAQSGLGKVSYAMCEQVRVVSRDRVYGRQPRGAVSDQVMAEIEDGLRILLGL
jgi:mRNA interferase MazF